MSWMHWLWLGIAIGAVLTIWGVVKLARSGKDLMDENSEDHLE